MTTTNIQQKVQLVKGEFTPSEASDIIEALIKTKINFHKIQRLKLWEGNCDSNTSGLDGRIDELLKDKIDAKKFIKKARQGNYNLQISGTLNLTLTEPSGEIKSFQISKN